MKWGDFPKCHRKLRDLLSAMGHVLLNHSFIHSVSQSFILQLTKHRMHTSDHSFPESPVCCQCCNLLYFKAELSEIRKTQHPFRVCARLSTRSSPTSLSWLKCIKLVDWHMKQMAKPPNPVLNHLGRHWRLVSLTPDIFLCNVMKPSYAFNTSLKSLTSCLKSPHK